MTTALLLAVLINISPVQAEVDEQRQNELRHMLKHDCGSCHGMSLKGGLGPALLPETLAGKPDAYLIHTIMYGRAPTPMPPWREILTEEEISWLVQELRKGPDHAQ